MRKTLFLVALLAVAAVAARRPAAPPPPAAAAAAAAALVPVLHLDAKSDMEVQFVFENRSPKPFAYLPANRPGEVHGLNLIVMKDGRPLEAVGTAEEPPVIARERVNQLQPGAGLPHARRLRDLYGSLEPGRYELEVRYSVAPTSVDVTEYGLTPVSVEQRWFLQVGDALAGR